MGAHLEKKNASLVPIDSRKRVAFFVLRYAHWPIIFLSFALVSCVDLLRQSAAGSEDTSPSTPLAQPQSIVIPSEQSAAELAAKQIVKGGELGRETLIRALIEAGFPVIVSQQRSALSNGDNGAGSPIFDWEVKAMVARANGTFVMPLPVLKKILNMIPEFQGIPWDTVILDSLRASSQSQSPETRYWAYLVDELGKRRFGNSLLDPRVTADSVLLTSLQYQLILRRLVSEILLSEKGTIGLNPDYQAPVVFASLSTLPYRLVAQNYKTTLDQCRKIGGNEISSVEALEGKFFEELIYKKLEKYGVGGTAAKAGKILRYLGAVGKIVDLINAGILLASLNIEHRLADGEPLVRTKKTTDGYEGTIVLKVAFDLEPAEYVNCTRPVAWTGATGGAVLEAPIVGGVKGASIRWEGKSGFFDHEWVKFRDNNPSIAIVQSIDPRREATVEIPDRSWQGYSSETDKNGSTKAIVVGRGQLAELSDDSVPIERRASILVQVATNDYDAGDVLGILTSNPTSLVYTAAKAGLFSFHTIEFQVRDWAPEYVLKLSSNGKYSSSAGMPLHFVETQGEIHLKPRKDSFGHIVYEAKGTRKIDVRPFGKCGAIIETIWGEEVVEVTGTIPSPERAELRMCYRGAKLSTSNMSCPCGSADSTCMTTKINEAGQGSSIIDSPNAPSTEITFDLLSNSASTLFLQHWQTEITTPHQGFCVELKDWQPIPPGFSGKRKVGAQILRESDSCPSSGFALATSCSSHFDYYLVLPKDKVGAVR